MADLIEIFTNDNYIPLIYDLNINGSNGYKTPVSLTNLMENCSKYEILKDGDAIKFFNQSINYKKIWMIPEKLDLDMYKPFTLSVLYDEKIVELYTIVFVNYSINKLSK